MKITDILLAFLKIGIFSFGGGYAMIPFIEEEIIEVNHWMTMGDFIDIIAIAQITPGPIAINLATFVGFSLDGLPGSIIATFGVVLLPVILSLLLSIYFNQFKDSKYTRGILAGLRPAVIGLIIAAEISIGKTAIVDYKSIIIAGVIFLFLYKFEVHPILAIILAGGLGIIFY